jgi:hypothetical protein
VTDCVVVLKVVLQAPLVVERAQAKVARYSVAEGVVDVVLETVSVFEHALAKITVMLVTWQLLDVADERSLAGQLERADTTPILVRVIDLFCRVCCRT